jgi:hypothetical protein
VIRKQTVAAARGDGETRRFQPFAGIRSSRRVDPYATLDLPQATAATFEVWKFHSLPTPADLGVAHTAAADHPNVEIAVGAVTDHEFGLARPVEIPGTEELPLRSEPAHLRVLGCPLGYRADPKLPIVAVIEQKIVLVIAEEVARPFELGWDRVFCRGRYRRRIPACRGLARRDETYRFA